MKKISKIMGVVLTLVVLASLMMIGATPASADQQPLQWNTEAVPSPTTFMLTPGSHIFGLAAGGDGTTLYAAMGLTAVSGIFDVMKSMDGGNSWFMVPTSNPAFSNLWLYPTMVAVAPDDSNLVAVASAAAGGFYLAGPTVFITTDGGFSWRTLGIPTGAVTITSIDISAQDPSNNTHYLAVAGTVAGPAATVWTYALGVGGQWTVASVPDFFGFYTGFQAGANALAVKFSPNFASDTVLTAVSTNTATYFQMYSVNQRQWNNSAAFGAGYPVNVTAATAATASIALAPTYLGDESTERVGFVGTDNGTAGAIYRLDDSSPTCITGTATTQYYSLAYDGSTLVGGTPANAIWRSPNPLEPLPSWVPTSSLKVPGGASNPSLVYAGTNVVAGTASGSSAIAISTDSGASFNDTALIDTTITTMDDVAVSADGSVVYLVTDNGATTGTSVWRYANSAWQRVLSRPLIVASNSIVRVSPSNPDVVYVGTTGGTTLYYSKTGGTTKWYQRTCVALADLAVEDDNIAYLGNGMSVLKTTNGGFTWGMPATAWIFVATLTLVSPGNVIAGSNNGFLAYSSPFGYTPIITQIVGAAGTVQATASDLNSGSYIYATSSGAAGVYRWQIGQAATVPYQRIDTAGAASTGIAYKGALYSSCAAAIRRNTMPYLPVPLGFDNIAAPAGAAFTRTPSALRLSSTAAYNKLWIIDNANATLYSWTDTLATVIPTLASPADGYKVKINPLSGVAYDVAVTWTAVADVSQYWVYVALDKDLAQVVGMGTITVNVAGMPSYSAVIGPTGNDITASFMPGTTYYWLVQTKAPVTSLLSEARSLIIESTPAAVPSIGAPANGASITNLKPSFSWSPVSGTTSYQFQLSDDPTFATMLLDTQLANTAYQSVTDLTVGKTYFWRVKAAAPVDSEWSTIANFTVVAPPVSVTAAPTINVPTITVPPITVPTPTFTVVPTTTAPAISAGLLWAVIIIGAVLVIALIVLIVRTRRTV